MTRADASTGTRALELASGSRHVTRSREAAAAGGCLNTPLSSAGGILLFGALRQPPVLVVR